MDGEYHTLSNQSVESNILFFGQENCLPNYFFKGNNVRHNYVIHYIQSGKGVFSLANHHAITLSAGDLFILPKGIPCFYQADGKDPWSYFWIGFSGVKIQSMLIGSDVSNKYYLRNFKKSIAYESFKKLFDAVHTPTSLANDTLIESLIYQFFYRLMTEYPNHSLHHAKDYNEQFKLAVNYLEHNFSNNNCSITQLCHQLDISRSYLYTLFKKNMNISPQKFLTQLRMEEAKENLNNNDYSVQQIANNVGYIDEFTFSKAFKRYTGFSPIHYRQNKE